MHDFKVLQMLTWKEFPWILGKKEEWTPESKATPQYEGTHFSGKQQGMACGRLAQHSTNIVNANEQSQGIMLEHHRLEDDTDEGRCRKMIINFRSLEQRE